MVHEDDDTLAFLGKWPTLWGCTVVAPKRHVEGLVADMSIDEYLALQAVVYRAAAAVSAVVATERVYVLSLGKPAGQCQDKVESVAVGSSAGAVMIDRRLGPDQAIRVAFLSTPARDPQMAARVTPFPAPARRTVHAVLPHTAHRRPSPAVFGNKRPPGPIRPGSDDEPVEVDQAEMVRRLAYVTQPPTPTLAMEVGHEDRQSLERMAHDLVEGTGRVPDPEEPSPTAQEPVEAPDDFFDRHQQPGTTR